MAVLGAGVSPNRRYARALPVLAAHGLLPGPAGFDPADLAAVAAARGWGVSTEPAAKATPARRWRATVSARRPGRGKEVSLGGAHGHGATAAGALAVALASLLRREG